MEDMVVGSKLRRIIDLWPEIQSMLEIGRLDSVVFAERVFMAEKMALYLDDEHVGLWRPMDEDKSRALLCDLGVSAVAHDASCDPGGWVNFRILPSDYLKIIDAAKTVAGRVEDNTSSTPLQCERGVKVEKENVGAVANGARPLPKSKLMSVIGIMQALASISDGKLTVPELAHALSSEYDGDLMLYQGGGYGLANPIPAEDSNTNKAYNLRVDLICELFNMSFWENPELTVKGIGIRDVLIREEDGVALAKTLWKFLGQNSSIDTPTLNGAASSRAVIDAPDYLDPMNPRYAPKLAAAVRAWQAVTDPNGKHPKQALAKWLREHATEFGLADDKGKPNEDGIEQVAKVANWKPGGGAPKTPSE